MSRPAQPLRFKVREIWSQANQHIQSPLYISNIDISMYPFGPTFPTFHLDFNSGYLKLRQENLL